LRNGPAFKWASVLAVAVCPALMKEGMKNLGWEVETSTVFV